MEKIISLFQRNYDGDRLVRNEVAPGAEWVIAGEGVPTRKWDGTCCLIRGGKLYKRYETTQQAIIDGKVPADFEPACEVDPLTMKVQGWRPVGDGPEDKWHREAFEGQSYSDGTYELCGPKVQGNPENFETHLLIAHGCHGIDGDPRTFDELKIWFPPRDIEGIVWHHPDGRMVKIKARDFGLKRAKIKRVEGVAV